MAEVLQLAHFVEDNSVPKMNVRRRRIQAQLDSQRNACCLAPSHFLSKFGLDKQLIASALDYA